MFDLGIELRSEENDDRRYPHPHHQTNAGALGAVRRVVVMRVFCQVPGKEDGASQPSHSRKNTAHSQPLPSWLSPARTQTVDHRQSDDNENKKDWPPRKEKISVSAEVLVAFISLYATKKREFHT